jgi:hypothetical protein
MKPQPQLWKHAWQAVLACLALSACAAPPSPAQRAEEAACLAQANAVYDQSTLDLRARTAQNGLRYGAMPTQVFDGQVMGAEHVRQSQIQDCEQTGNNNGQAVPRDVPTVAPRIIN